MGLRRQIPERGRAANMAAERGVGQQQSQEMMEVDRRVESEESGDEEGKKHSSGIVADLSEQSLKDGEERGEEDPEEEHELPVDMETINLDRDAEDVDLNHCRIGKIEGFEVLKKVKAIENIDTLTNLESLFLGKNKITKLQNLDALTNLTVLSMQSNRLTKIEGLQNLVNLRELYLSHNGIEVIEGLENNNKLTMLDIASNRIKKIENISHLTELQEFWMNDNLLESWSDLDELKGARSLETVYLERNPLQKDPQYRRKVMLALPSVRQIDATFVRF
ncbi:protein phosphatase 1 regulatory subunit 7 isoform X8 [Trachypithecus francoisi]|uniref:protein phosphatase 1 regulatory subunit 7 isoform X8 n=1 Tax=Trachypithecus francoisi TaxID=54180 RepID=UPI00141AD111|nr:protein phosphatase 1 regulatory subunit 7 isoform X8 [Trachypithecus francoisi]